ncbi:hypothetical protein [Thiocystis violacea]|uniref:hypothetical protein n=1 Tax=Thiocystis violacea TaxID=13725 RepID=UPI0019056059|nr:hypothetical protein [Thiocystis violacea]MBK1722631.1 hypothetical protein [Thiocystis violacea]
MPIPQPFSLTPLIAVCLCLVACDATQPVRVDDGVELPAVNTTTLNALLTPNEALEILTFPDVGRMTLTGLLQDDGGTAYAVPVAKGQGFSVALTSANDAAYFDLIDTSNPTGTAVFRGEVEGRTADLKATDDTTYLIRPRLPAMLTRQGGGATFGIEVARGALGVAPTQPGARAQAEPDAAGESDRAADASGAGRGQEAATLGAGRRSPER